MKPPQPWPIQGGELDIAGEPRMTDLVISGHEDGVINIWTVSTCKLRLVLTSCYKLNVKFGCNFVLLMQ